VADDILSQFLVRIAYQQDDKSRQKFDEGLKQVQTRAAEFGAKIGELPTIVSEATKRISSSLSEMYYSAQKNGATARELDALRYAAKQSGEGADRAEASFNAFSQRIRDFATGASRQYKQMFGVDVDPNHTLDAFIKVREKIEELRNRGGAENLSRANLYARTFGVDEDALIHGRLAEFKKRLDEQLKRNSNIGAEKAIALTHAYNALAAALETVARKADAALFDKFGAVLDRLTKRLDEDSERIVKFFTDLAAQIGLVFTDLSKLSPAFVLLWDALKEVGGWLQKIIGQPDSSGLAGVRHLLELISGVVMARFVASMVLGFAAAFAPLTALLAALAAIGIVGLYSGVFGRDAEELGFGGQGGTESAGREGSRRGRMGYRGANKAIGAAPTSAQAKATEKESWDFWKAQGLSDAGAAAVVATEQGESGFNPRNIGDSGAAHGSFQWHMDRVNKILAATGIDVRTASHLDQLKAAKWEGEHGDAQAREAWQAVLHATSSADATRAMTYLFERPANKAGDTYTRQGFANRILREHGGNKTPIANPLTHLDQNFDQKLKILKDAKPLGSDQHSMNEIHDHRSVDNNVNINVASASTVDTMTGLLGRPRNADLIRNTASYAA